MTFFAPWLPFLIAALAMRPFARVEVGVVDHGRHECDDRGVNHDLADGDEERDDAQLPDRREVHPDRRGESGHQETPPRLRDQDRLPTVSPVDDDPSERREGGPRQVLGCGHGADQQRGRGQRRSQERQRSKSDAVTRVGDERTPEEGIEARAERLSARAAGTGAEPDRPEVHEPCCAECCRSMRDGSSALMSAQSARAGETTGSSSSPRTSTRSGANDPIATSEAM